MGIKPCNMYSHQMRWVLICHPHFFPFKTLSVCQLSSLWWGCSYHCEPESSLTLTLWDKYYDCPHCFVDGETEAPRQVIFPKPHSQEQQNLYSSLKSGSQVQLLILWLFYFLVCFWSASPTRYVSRYMAQGPCGSSSPLYPQHVGRC